MGKTTLSFPIKFNHVINDINQGAEHVDHTLGNGAEFAQDPLSLQWSNYKT